MFKEEKEMKVVLREERKVQRERETAEEKARRAAERAAFLAKNKEERRLRKEQEKLANRMRRKAALIDIRNKKKATVLSSKSITSSSSKLGGLTFNAIAPAQTINLLPSSTTSTAAAIGTSSATILSSHGLAIRGGAREAGTGGAVRKKRSGGLWQRRVRFQKEPVYDPVVPRAWVKLAPERFGSIAAAAAKCAICHLSQGGTDSVLAPDWASPVPFLCSPCSEPASPKPVSASSPSRRNEKGPASSQKLEKVKDVTLADCGPFISPPIVTR